ncbi:MAG TPA: gamma-glutamyl-gamma-aminobutyrate hydrolase family protein [Pyrinomonadaceae bacterium]|nr:gamma-glutamyl-gamma-aminobutyrate hydrolase family protein [Pyrinomonadaceae bacterium]
MTQELLEISPITQPAEFSASLPFPFNQQTFCRYEPVEQRIEKARVLVIDNLLRDENDLSEVARAEWGATLANELKRERLIAGMAVDNILANIARLVKDHKTHVAHVSEIAEAAAEFAPDAIVLSGTLRDFDYYQQSILDNFGSFIRTTKIPVLAICGGHQLVGLSFGARVVTLANLEQHEQRAGRPQEYQYRYVRITEPGDPIFTNIAVCETPREAKGSRILHVWQNHGLQLDRIPDGFQLLATSYLCRNQMMVKRTEGQLIYTVQFHLEKSFEDWNKSRTRWEHPNESRDGRILFENFLILATS